MNNNKRVPRPIGTSELGKQYNITKDEEHYISLKQNIIHHYIRNNFSYCGHYMGIEEFAYMIKENVLTVQKELGHYGKALSKVNNEMVNNDMLRALANFSFSWALEDRSLASQQLHLLLQSQGSSYAPFISGEVNKAIKLGMDANTNIQALMRSLSGNGNGAILPIESPNENEGNKGITIDQAIKAIKDMAITPLLQDDQGINNLAIEYGLNDIPEVNALLQNDYDSSREGLTMGDITKLPQDKVSHENRREEEFDIDPEEDEM